MPRRDHSCETVGELLASIAYLIDRGETHTAVRQARDCAWSFSDVPLPELDEDGRQIHTA